MTPSGTARLHVVLALVGAIFATWLIQRGAEPRGSPPPRAPVIAGIPRGAALLATIDVPRLRESRLGRVLFAEGRSWPGLGTARDVCGFDPAPLIDEVAFVVPSGAHREAVLGVVARGRWPQGGLSDCARTVIARRGDEPGTTRIEGFDVVRARRGSGAEIASRNDGLVVVSEGAYLRDLLDASEGHAPTVLEDTVHMETRARLGNQAAILVSIALPQGWAADLADDDGAGGAPELDQVRALGLRVDVAPSVAIHLLAACEARSACLLLSALLEGARTEGADVARRLLGVDVLGKIQSRVSDQLFEADLTLTPDEAERVVTSLLDVLSAEP